MRRDIDFRTSDGTTLRGWHFAPKGEGRFSTIVMAHGFAAVKEMHLDKFAEAFANAGFACVVYDNRGFGASDGFPRPEIEPWLQVRDYSDAITFVLTLEQTDATRLGIWGSSYSGVHVLVVAAIDRRVKCVVSQAPAISELQEFHRPVRADFLSTLKSWFHADRADGLASGAPAMIPVVAAGPMAPSEFPTVDSCERSTGTAAACAPSWRSGATRRFLEHGPGHEPGDIIGLISPTPLLLIVAPRDPLAVSDFAIAAYLRAREPKKLILLSGTHLDAYVKEFDQSSGAALAWFGAHLG